MTMDVIVALLMIGVPVYIVGKSFYDNALIEKKGTTVTAMVLKSEQLSSNETGSINGAFIVKFNDAEKGPTIVGFESTIPQLYAPRVQPGCEIQVRYLGDGDIVKAYFIFE
ncbi:hypothetical protein ACOJD8_001841 [Cronobacter turicensis]|uniref:hypothetical protein n=1 Tax=unclassified Cronobacter TaxID=2649764 RepID=UPI0005197167|nr:MULTISPECIES: hypothetical protein [unclassified Cronobacter]ELQ6221476.1 hypothetical protein [Cronobacter turicensis]ELQ6227217.1 hypothetical protein [Cronobacter turicensis]ELY2742054.1 hypothetical protein [Cronobacter turicensis]ELY2785559.1 hypothetical protein [Cronobacter turicensis]KAF6589789.1 hypothetical protein G9G39_22305 [Cronobacter sp. EKM101R]